MKREASARWNGGFKDGSGAMTTSSGAVKDLKYSAGTRFENNPGTNPEELIAAAHAGCFSMAFSVQLGNAGITPETIDTRASANFEKLEGGWTVTAIHLAVSVKARRRSGGDQDGGREREEGLPDLAPAQGRDHDGSRHQLAGRSL
jgi:osmotically inducible protein OsmC